MEEGPPFSYINLACSDAMQIVDAVHANGSFLYLQLWALGRAADAELLQTEGPYDVVGASALPIPDRPDRPTPRPLTVDEIKEYAQWYAKAAKNAVEGAGFDGPFHCADMVFTSGG